MGVIDDERRADEAHIEFAQGVISTPVTAAGEMHVEMGAADVERE